MKTTERIVLAGGIIAAATVGLAVLLVVAMKEPSDRDSREAAAPSKVALTGSATQQSLPPAGTPLSRAMPVLAQLSAQGDALAACRLAAELDACHRQTALIEAHARWLAQRALAIELSSVDSDPSELAEFTEVFNSQLASRERILEAAAAHCSGLRPYHPEEIIELWRDAAHKGSRAAVLHYAGGSVFGYDQILETHHLLPRYSAEAESLLLELASEGDLEAIKLLANAHSPARQSGNSLLGQSVEKDGPKSLALYARALAALSGNDSNIASTMAADLTREAAEVKRMLTEDELGTARDIELELRARWRPVRSAFSDDASGARQAAHCMQGRSVESG